MLFPSLTPITHCEFGRINLQDQLLCLNFHASSHLPVPAPVTASKTASSYVAASEPTPASGPAPAPDPAPAPEHAPEPELAPEPAPAPAPAPAP